MKSPSLMQSVGTKKLPPRFMNGSNTFSAKLQNGNERDPWKRWDWFSIHNLIYSLGKETFGKCTALKILMGGSADPMTWGTPSAVLVGTNFPASS